MSYGFISFENSGYLSTRFENCRKYTSHQHEYGIYLNDDPQIANEQIEAFTYHSEKYLKEIYEKQGKPYYYVMRKYPNVPCIFFKKENKELKIKP